MLRAAFAACSLVLITSVATAQNCANTSTGMIPIDDLGAGTYQGLVGGLYPGGVNVRPMRHTLDGLAQGTQIVPRDATGAPSADGKIVMLSIGMSNCWQEFIVLTNLVQADPTRNPALVLVNGAQTGAAAATIAMPDAQYWTNCDTRLAAEGVTPAQVQVIWMKCANLHPMNGFPGQATQLAGEYRAILHNIKARYPNVRQALLASRIYAGYATSTLSPEPYAYEHGFVVQWTIGAQIDRDPALEFDATRGPVMAPWIDWGTYNWADGTRPRGDGLTWLCAHFQNDGTHPSAQGRTRVAQRVLAHLQSDAVASRWYLAAPPPVNYGTPKNTSQGSAPSMGSTGAPRLATQDFALRVTNGLPNSIGIVFVGTRPALTPALFSQAYAERSTVRLAPQSFDAGGVAEWPIPVDAAMVGTTRFYQCVLRDPAQPDGTGLGLSDGLCVVFSN